MHLDVNFYIPFLSPQLLLLTSIVSIAIGLCLTILGLVRIKIYKKSTLSLVCIVFGSLIIVSHIIQIIMRSL